MDMLKLWSSNDPAGLLRLARDIQEHGSWKAFLSREEHRVFEDAVAKGGDVWAQFIVGQAVCQVETSERALRSASNVTTNGLRAVESSVPRAASSTPQPGAMPLASNEIKTGNGMIVRTLDASTLAFRVRYMLYDKAIGVLFPSRDPEVSLDIASSVFEDPDVERTVIKPAARRLEDDYDLDEDDDEDDNNSTNDIVKDVASHEEKAVIKGEPSSSSETF